MTSRGKRGKGLGKEGATGHPKMLQDNIKNIWMSMSYDWTQYKYPTDLILDLLNLEYLVKNLSSSNYNMYWQQKYSIIINKTKEL